MKFKYCITYNIRIFFVGPLSIKRVLVILFNNNVFLSTSFKSMIVRSIAFQIKKKLYYLASTKLIWLNDNLFN